MCRLGSRNRSTPCTPPQHSMHSSLNIHTHTCTYLCSASAGLAVAIAALNPFLSRERRVMEVGGLYMCACMISRDECLQSHVFSRTIPTAHPQYLHAHMYRSVASSRTKSYESLTYNEGDDVDDETLRRLLPPALNRCVLCVSRPLVSSRWEGCSIDCCVCVSLLSLGSKCALHRSVSPCHVCQACGGCLESTGVCVSW